VRVVQGQKMTILDNNVIFGLKMAFFGSNEPFSRRTRIFLDQKMAICSKICFFSEENYQERLVKVKIGPFFETNEHFLGQKKGISSQYSQYGAKMPCC
jgi:hypothetical protein